MKNKFFIEVFLNGKLYSDFLKENSTCLKTDLTIWYEEIKKNEKNFSLISRLRTLYNTKNFKGNDILFSDFYDWYQRQGQHCEYCKITQNEINELFKNDRIKFSRGGRRGRNLEIDRKSSKVEYGRDLNNLVLCCYWCNNAKTDEFSAEEFIPVGKAIGDILRKRLKKGYR